MLSIHRLPTAAAALLVVILPGCGDDSAAPTPADVSGLYVLVSETSVAICDPTTAFDVLEPALGDIPIRFTLRVEQLGNDVRFTPVKAEGLDGRPVHFANIQVLTVPLARDGSVRIENRVSDEVDFAGHHFFHELISVATGGFDLEADPMGFSVTGTNTQVFRDNGPGGPVFATCSETQTNSGERTGD